VGGNDLLDGGTGADTLHGGAGDDTYIVDNAGDKVIEHANQGVDLVEASVSFAIGANVENLTMIGAGNINGTGNGLANVITGNGGNNVLSGLGGDDRLVGGLGIDTLTGGSGKDTFCFNMAPQGNRDVITDFNAKDDTIELSKAAFPLLKAGTLKKKDFAAGTKKPAKDNHLVYYDKKKGGLWYDTNGSKKGGDVEIAVLSKGLGLTNADIVVA
jgi:Ca2+-binding RTX toxin-like protein